MRDIPYDAIKLMQEALKARGLYDDKIDGDWGPNTESGYRAYIDMTHPKPVEVSGDGVKIGDLKVSQEALDLILKYETGGRAYYNKYLRTPSWPKGYSGVTVGVGFDLGYNTQKQIEDAWKDHVTETELNYLKSASGLKGRAASDKARSIRQYVDISWEDAVKVFEESTLPRFANLTYQAFPGVQAAHPHIQGVLLSLVFNRGASMSGSRREEMRNIKKLVALGDYDGIPAQIRSMKRLWRGKGLDGLLKRRDSEAALVETVV